MTKSVRYVLIGLVCFGAAYAVAYWGFRLLG